MRTCDHCGKEKELFEAPNPFTEGEIIHLCERCSKEELQEE
jgi:hypothetical protein